MKKAFIFLGLIAILLCATASLADYKEDLNLYREKGHRSAKWDEYVELGFKAFDEQNFATALVFLKKAYETGCRDGLAMVKLGAIFEAKGQAAEAIKITEEAAPKLKETYPSLPITKDIDLHLGLLYYHADQYDKALPAIDAALKNDPNNFTLLFISGQILRSMKILPEAYTRLRMALAATVPPDVTPNPKIAVMKELMALTYELKRYDEALKYADAILAVEPKNATVLSYKNAIQRARLMQQQDVDIKKLME